MFAGVLSDEHPHAAVHRGAAFRVLCMLSCLGAALLAPDRAMAEEFVLLDVVVEHEQPLPTEQIRRLWPWEPGQEVTRVQIENRMGLVRKLPFIEEVRWELQEVEGGVVLRMDLDAREIVRDVEITGLGQVWRPIFEPTARGALRLRAGDGFDGAKLEADRARIEELFRGMGFFAVRCETELERASGSGTVAILHACDRGNSFSVGEITVTGAEAIAPATVAEGIRPWPYYRKQHIDENAEDVLEEYRDLGYVAAKLDFGDPVVHLEDETVDLVVTVTEGKVLELHFEGNEALDDDDLAEVLPFRPERSYGTFLVSDGAAAIASTYELEGYPDVVVDGDRDIEDDRVVVRYQVEEGPEHELDRVRVEGNSAFETERLEELLAGANNRWLVFDAVWDRKKLAADRAALRSFYRAQGYADVQVSEPRREESPESLTAVFKVVEGERYTIASVEVVGVPEELDATVAPILDEARDAGAYRAGDVTNWSQRFARAMHDHGFLNAAVTPKETRDGVQVHLHFEAVAGPQFVTGPVFLVGNDLTSRGVIEDALEIEEGTVLLPEAMAASQKQVRSLDVFESIRLTPLGLNDATGSSLDGRYRAPIALVFRERPRMELGFGIRYDTDRGAGATASIRHNNLFGRALHGSLEGEIGQRDLVGRLSLSDPRLFGTSVRGTTFVSYSDRELEAFDEEEFLTGAVLARDLGDEWTVAFDLSYRLTDISNVKDADDPDSPEAGFSRALLWTPSVSYDSRDNPLSPTSGYFSFLGVTLSNTGLVSDDDFVRIDFQGRGYHSFAENWVGVLALSFTDVELYGETDSVPSSELLFAGGGTTVRGFEEDRIGPLGDNGSPQGGGTRVVANAELRFPMYLPVEGALFLDAGSVTPGISELDLSTFQAAAGVGLRLRSPVGPVRVDYGYQLEDNSPLDRWRIHFSFGYPF